MTNRAVKALIADDDEGIIWVLEKFFAEKKIPCVKAEDGTKAAELLRENVFSLAVVDINMPGKDGLTLLKESKEQKARTSFIIMTAESTMENTIAAMKLGAFDYISKPFDLSELEIIIDRAIEDLTLKEKVAAIEDRLKEFEAAGSAFIGKSKAVQPVFKTIGKAAPKDVTVLLLGESGTGKELAARMLHTNSPRCHGPFVAINCAAVPKDLMESELFGFEKGAFTGATDEKKGRFELANGGTLFLDEIGDMPPELQSKLLRAIQEREFYRIGGKAAVRINVRIVAATNRDLEKAVADKTFREDLYYRMNGVTITLPPLRERKGDAALLVEFYLGKFCAEFGVGKKTLSEKAMDAIETYRWPGNVRELENVLRRAILLSTGSVLSLEDMNLPRDKYKAESLEDLISVRLKPFIDKTDPRGKQHLFDFIMQFMERPLIKLVLEKTRGNQVQAAELLGINRNTLRKKISELKIKLDGLKG